MPTTVFKQIRAPYAMLRGQFHSGSSSSIGPSVCHFTETGRSSFESNFDFFALSEPFRRTYPLATSLIRPWAGYPVAACALRARCDGRGCKLFFGSAPSPELCVFPRRRWRIRRESSPLSQGAMICTLGNGLVTPAKTAHGRCLCRCSRGKAHPAQAPAQASTAALQSRAAPSGAEKIGVVIHGAGGAKSSRYSRGRTLRAGLRCSRRMLR